MNSIDKLSNVFIFLFFILFLFSTLGNQVFSGQIYYRCRSYPYFNNSLGRYISPIDFSINHLCSYDDSSFKCPKNLSCVNFFDIPKAFNLSNNITLDNFSLVDEKMNETKFINYGITNFDLIPYAALTVFITFRMQNWVKLLDIVKLIFS